MANSLSYMQSGFVFAFNPILIRASPLWKIMAPFQLDVWISIAVLLTISILTIILSRRLSIRQRHFIIGGTMNRTPIMNMLSVLIGNTIPNPKLVFARTLAILWIFFWLVVRNRFVYNLSVGTRIFTYFILLHAIATRAHFIDTSKINEAHRLMTPSRKFAVQM